MFRRLQQELSQISKEAEAMGTSEGMMSAPPSARSSPVSGKSKSLGMCILCQLISACPTILHVWVHNHLYSVT